MEGFSQRESALLGFGPQRSFIKDHSSTSTQQRNSDIDFNDVFGGPPRRSSVHEIRFCYSEATENYAFRGDNGGTAASRNSWTGLSEKPVFGEEGFNRRRHNTSENFFNDIFKGNESLSSSPRKGDWDPYSSSPAGSRVLSPARPLPPQAEPFGTSLPAQFSLPAKLTKGMDLPTFGSAPRSPYKSKDGASNGTRSSYCLSQGHNERNDTRSYRQSLLSRELLSNSKESSDLTKHDETDIRGNLEREPNSLEVLASGNQFHFSIYKWASKGVPLAMPLRGGNGSRSRENSISDRGTSSVEWIASERELPTEMLHETKLPSNNGVSANTKSLTMQHDKQNSGTPDTSTQDRAERVQRVDPGNTTSHCTGQQTKSNSQSEIDLHCKSEKEASVVAEEAHKPELKPLYCLFYDNDYEQSNVEITEKAGEKERMVKNIKKLSVTPDFNKNGKKQNGRRASLDSAEVAKGSPQGPPMNSRDPGKIRLKGKVKEFVKIFNQEGLSKSKVNVDPSSQSSRWKHTVNFKAEEANFSETGADEKIHLSSGHVKTLSSDAPVMVNGNLPHSEKKQSAMNGNNRMSNGTSGRNDASSTGNSLKALVGDVDDSFQGNFLAKELTQDKNRQQKVGNDPEELQVIDSKIRKWSNGKEGNIRSLLSTLQYVLWPESGWKTVPLVDIIDGHAVKRCYQKALLCLHPDKLQQNGATSRQKYIAEKVFDILQDAWTHFNSLGSL